MFADGLALGVVGRVELAMVDVVGSRASSACGGEDGKAQFSNVGAALKFRSNHNGTSVS